MAAQVAVGQEGYGPIIDEEGEGFPTEKEEDRLRAFGFSVDGMSDEFSREGNY